MISSPPIKLTLLLRIGDVWNSTDGKPMKRDETAVPYGPYVFCDSFIHLPSFGWDGRGPGVQPVGRYNIPEVL
jgi:hypothetical protein